MLLEGIDEEIKEIFAEEGMLDICGAELTATSEVVYQAAVSYLSSEVQSYFHPDWTLGKQWI